MRVFKKLVDGGNRLYSKIKSEAPRALGKISHGLHTASSIIDRGVGFLNSAPVRSITSLIAPELALPGQALLKGASIASKLLKQGSHVSNPNSYHGTVGEVAHDALQRAIKLKKDVDNGISFH
jgi:hypothetical protein